MEREKALQKRYGELQEKIRELQEQFASMQQVPETTYVNESSATIIEETQINEDEVTSTFVNNEDQSESEPIAS